MTPEEIIAMAREAGFRIGRMDTLEGSRTLAKHSWFDCLAEIERFAALVAAKEREACALVCDATYYQHIGPGFGEVRHGIAVCASAIRARGQKEGA